MAHEPLPPAPPAWLTARRVALGAIAIGSAVAALPSCEWIAVSVMRDSTAARLAVVAVTTWLAQWVVRRTLRRGLAPGGAAGRIMIAATGWAVVNAGLCFGAVALVTGGGGGALFAIPVGMILGIPFGAPIGFLWGIALAPIVHAAASDEALPSHDAADRMLVRAGSWLGCVALASALAAPTRPYAEAAVLLAIASAAAVGIGLARLAAWRSWLARVRRGEVDGYRIVAPDAPEALSAAVHAAHRLPPPVARGESLVADAMLLRVELGEGGDGRGHGPYRGGLTHIGVARVPAGGAPR